MECFLTSILMYFGSQVGMENQLKIDPKRHRKNDAKKKATKMANKTVKSPTPPIDLPGPDPGEVPPFKAGQPSGADANPRLAYSGL